MSQEHVLFKRILYKNILYGKLDVTKDEVYTVTKNA